MKELILGAGSTKIKRMTLNNLSSEYENPVTVDINKDHNPDVLWDLNKLPLPFEDNEFDEIHAYDVLEHLGHQGDYESFFNFFNDLWRILKPNGKLFALVPHWNSLWAWGDPGHVRVINGGTLSFLDREQYEIQVGKSAMTDYRFIYKGNFKLASFKEIKNEDTGEWLYCGFVLHSVKDE